MVTLPCIWHMSECSILVGMLYKCVFVHTDVPACAYSCEGHLMFLDISLKLCVSHDSVRLALIGWLDSKREIFGCCCLSFSFTSVLQLQVEADAHLFTWLLWFQLRYLYLNNSRFNTFKFLREKIEHFVLQSIRCFSFLWILLEKLYVFVI